MSLTQANPREYFSTVQLRESQLVRFCMKPSQSQLDIVVNYAAETVGGYFQHLHAGGSPEEYKVQIVDFRLLRFLGVSDIHTQLEQNVPSGRAPSGNSDREWKLHEQTLLFPRARLITGADFADSSDGFACILYFDSFGEHSWRFHQFFVDRRVASVSRDGNSFKYKDSSTGAIIDVSNPFADQMA